MCISFTIIVRDEGGAVRGGGPAAARVLAFSRLCVIRQRSSTQEAGDLLTDE